MADVLGLYIAGASCPATGEGSTAILNPATGEEIGRLAVASAADLEKALDAAQRGFVAWRQMAVADRCRLVAQVGQLMRERVEAMGRDLTLEEGKPLAQAKGEILATADYFTAIASAAVNLVGRIIPAGSDGARRSVTYEPIGPIFAVSPWNLPAMMPGRKIANSLAAGCSIIVKPAKETPRTTHAIAKCCEDAGIPAGVVNVVSGDSGRISAAMIGSSVIRKVSFTGSTDVGRELAALAGRAMKKITLELGGHAPVIIFDDVDVPAVAKLCVYGRYANAGQSCIAPTRFFVHRRIYDEFVALFTRHAGALRIGDGLDPQTEMGPLASARRLPVMDALVQDAVRHGARLLAGGSRLDRKGFFYAPTVLADVPHRAAIMTEEPFGPVTPILPFDDPEDVVARANETPYGLGAFVFSRDVDRASQVVARIEAGMIAINSMSVAHPTLPFGGVKDSGIGREGALDGLLDSMVTKSVSIGR